MVIVQQVIVIEVAAYFSGGMHGGVEVKIGPVRECGELAGEHVVLDLGGDAKLCAHALLFAGDLDQVVEVFYDLLFQAFDLVVEVLDLIVAVDVEIDDIFEGVVALFVGELAGLAAELLDGLCHIAAHEEDACDRGERGQKKSAQKARHGKLLVLAVEHFHADIHADYRDRGAFGIVDGLETSAQEAV